MSAVELPPAMGTPIFGTDNEFTYRELHAAILGAGAAALALFNRGTAMV